MCGFDLRMPDRPFPTSESFECPRFDSPIPPTLIMAFQKYVGTEQTITQRLGCLVKRPGLATPHNWMVWTFEHGMLALPLSATPDAFLGAWVQNRVEGAGGQLRVVWKSSWEADWFRVHAYSRSVTAQGGEPPGGWILPLAVAGDAGDRTKDDHGDVIYDLSGIDGPATWDVLIVGCQKEYVFGVLTGHDCTDDVLLKLTVSVGKEPPQPFSCKVHHPPPSPILTAYVAPPEGVVLQVGDCTPGSPYGLFLYYWTANCLQSSPALSNGANCPTNAFDFGFVVVAPSRGWSIEEFRATIETSTAAWRRSGNQYQTRMPASVDVPLSPKVIRRGDIWTAVEPSSHHTVTFQWSPDNVGSVITGDSGAPGLFGAGSITTDPDQWPSTRSHVTAPDVPTAWSSLVVSAGTGCFTVAGLPTPDDPDLIGLLVDLRNASTPTIAEPKTSKLASVCP